ncbi:hypothetical protein J1TS3_13810 [Siminovitchia fordii]|uniref:Uncharacterized protein n=1 Tax=Siminovitchia fordii TaxID=254759 RepID=A0ABQ4K3C1_9BACI|nr:hypothetical protein J1TS3_13810 [Siminovitchia fordii]
MKVDCDALTTQSTGFTFERILIYFGNKLLGIKAEDKKINGKEKNCMTVIIVECFLVRTAIPIEIDPIRHENNAGVARKRIGETIPIGSLNPIK